LNDLVSFKLKNMAETPRGFLPEIINQLKH